ncbi:MAG: peptidase [Methylotenera sp.]
MSYSLSIHTDEGLVLCASTVLVQSTEGTQPSTNMQRFIWPGDRFVTILSSGNQKTIDSVLNKIRQDLNTQLPTTLLTPNTMDEIADYIAAISVQQQKNLIQQFGEDEAYEANFIVAGQIANKQMATLLIYAQGNFIHEPNSSPFLQIGEIKYGKPILDRVIKRDTNLNTAAHAAFVSVDSNIKSNPSNLIKTEIMIYKKDSLEISAYLVLDNNDAFFKNTSASWNQGVIGALETLPKFYWE